VGLERTSCIRSICCRSRCCKSIRHYLCFAGSVDTDIDTFLTALDSKATDQEKAEELAKATPKATISASETVGRTLNTISGIISTRQSRVRGFSSGDKAFTDRNVWIKPYVSYASQSNKDNIKGFSANTKGFAIGVDGESDTFKRIGVAFSYATSDVDTNDITQTSDIESYSLIIYGSQPIIDSKANISYQSRSWSSSLLIQADLAQAMTTAADYNSKLYFIQAVIDRNINIKDNMSFTPMIKASYRYFDVPSYSESGAGGMNLDVQSYNTSEQNSWCRGAFMYTLNSSINFIVSGNIDYDFKNDAPIVSSGLVGGGGIIFETEGIENSPYIYRGGAICE
ncbi:MAG: autotransporter outer membrane beta-barrel domain-containing protein, partial [Sulfurimonas sp.]|nr:autotransporter outer membrane beta-barrel domain-containing protein [Sulfurimonas sp.]